MPTISVPAETYAGLAKLAAERGTTVEAVALPLLTPPPPPGDDDLLPPEEIARRLKGLEELTRLAERHAARLPPGHEVDCSRESIYEGCGE